MSSEHSSTLIPPVLNAPPPDAEEEVTARWPDGTKRNVFFLLDGQSVWFQNWSESGDLDRESGLRGRCYHGPYRTWHSNGQLCEESFYIEGKEHGTARQWDEDGRLIGMYVMERGTGIDQWFHALGVLSEEREYQDGDKHGVERDYWLDGSNSRVVEEKYYKRSVEHGIHRRWGRRGGLRRGFPHFYIDGRRISKRQYITATAADPSLPPYRPEDDANYRTPLQPFMPLPAEGSE